MPTTEETQETVRSNAEYPMPDIRIHDRVHVPYIDGGVVTHWGPGIVLRVTKFGRDVRYIVELSDHRDISYGATQITCGICYGEPGKQCMQCTPRSAERVLTRGEKLDVPPVEVLVQATGETVVFEDFLPRLVIAYRYRDAGLIPMVVVRDSAIAATVAAHLAEINGVPCTVLPAAE